MKKHNVLLSTLFFLLLVLGFNRVTFAQIVNYEYMTSKVGVELNKPWLVKFTQELDKSTINTQNIYISDNINDKVNCRVSLQPDNKTVKVEPISNYKYGTQYKLMISTDVKATIGKSLIKPVIMTFTTKNDHSTTNTDKFTVCIDAGHGGSDPSVLIGPDGIKESDISLSIALKLGDILKNNSINVVYTRTNDVNIDPNTRFAISNVAQANYFVSIHCNTSLNIDSNGFEVYYGDGDNSGMNLAQSIQEEVTISTGLYNRKIKPSSSIAELKGTNASAVKVFLGFINNPSEEKKMGDSSFQDKYANAMARAIMQCRNDGDALNVKTIKTIVQTITEGESYSLSSTIQVTLMDDTIQNVPVVWDCNSVDNNKPGTYVCKGIIDGYRKPVYATMLVISKNGGNKPIVCIDPGHGGTDPGAIGVTGTKESNLNLSIALKVGKILEDSGINVVYTRNDNDIPIADETENLQYRCDISNMTKANYFVCIHANSAISTATGIETYYSNGSNAGQMLAENIQSELIKATGTNDRGIRSTAQHGLYVVDNTDCPAILTEVGFISNTDEEALLKTDEYQSKCAQAIALGVLKSLGKVQ